MIDPDTPARIALRAYAEASKGVRCPICNGIEGCDHTVRERLLADLNATSLARAEAAEQRVAELEDVMTQSVEQMERMYTADAFRNLKVRAEAAEKRVIELEAELELAVQRMSDMGARP